MPQKTDGSSQNAVNLPELLVRVENDHDLLCDLISIFKRDFPALLQSLQRAVDCGDVRNVETTSHALKGMLSGLAVTQAAVTASRLEQMAREGKKMELTAALTRLENEVASLSTELDGYAAEANR